MEIKVSEIYEKQNNDLTKICEELDNLITGKHIELYEYDDEIKDYSIIDEYDVDSVNLWEGDDQIVFSFGPTEWDICSIYKTDIIKIKE